MIRLRQLFRRGKRPGPQVPPDIFDIHHARTMGAVPDSRGTPLGEWSVADTESAARAPRFILGVLRARSDLRRKFPSAISSDSGYRAWLLERGAEEYKLSAAARENIAAAFADDLAGPVREFYLHTPEVQWRYPLGLLPVGQKRFVKWLLGKGRAQHPFSDEQILWFLHATAEDLPRHIALTYLIHPVWQEQFPHAPSQPEALLRWLRTQFPKYRPLQEVRSLPLSLPQPESHPSEGLNILSHFCYASGLQQAGALTREALELAGVRTSCRDVPAGVPTKLESRLAWLGLETYPITLSNVSPVPHFESRYRRAGLAPRPGLVHIAYWAWELDSVPEEWRQLAQGIDEIWTPSPFVSEAMRGMPVPVYDMLPGLAIGEVEKAPRARFGIDESEFVFLFMFDMRSDFRRKNPLGLVRAFQRAFRASDRATLLIKISRGASDVSNLALLEEAAAGSKIVLVDELVSRPQAYGYIAMCDCVVSLHRSEGFGFLMAEAMQLGKPVIATNYSGNTAFMTAANSLLVDYELVHIAEDGPIYKKGNRWAEPSEERAAQYMRRLYEDREEAAVLGAQGRVDVTEQLSLAAAGARMKARLDQLRQKCG